MFPLISPMFRLTILLLFASLILVNANENARILRGEASEEGKWPFMAAIRDKESEFYFCGAAIWHSSALVTAGHCVHGPDPTVPDLEIVVGTTNLKHVNPANVYSIAEVKVHEQYDTNITDKMNENTNEKMNDIAIIRLTKEIDFSQAGGKIGCVCEPEPLEQLDTDQCIVMGWGRDEYGNNHLALREALQFIIDCSKPNPECKNVETNEANLAVANYAEQKSAYSGDSGGPLVCPLKANPTVYSFVGIVSGGDVEQGKVLKPAFYTRVLYYRDWIEKNAPDKDEEEPITLPYPVRSQSSPTADVYLALVVIGTFNVLMLFI